MSIDLHCHTRYSDGSTPLETVIPGVEISAADPKRHGKAHILCYKPKKPEVLLPLLQKTTDSRHAAMLRSVDKVCRLYAIPREMILRRAEGSTNIYKQHVLQALMDAGYLAVTGGTDYHGFYTTKKNPVGTFTTAESEFDKLFSE